MQNPLGDKFRSWLLGYQSADGIDSEAKSSIASGGLVIGLLEAALLFAVLLIVNTLFLNGGINTINPHPFWIPVVLISFQYGMMSGLCVTISATVLAQFIGWPPHSAYEDHYQYFLRVWSNPAMWLWASVILGGLGQKHIMQRQKFLSEQTRFAEERTNITEYCQGLQRQLESHQHEVATRTDEEGDRLLELLERIQGCDRASLRRELPDIISTLFGKNASGCRARTPSGNLRPSLTVKQRKRDRYNPTPNMPRFRRCQLYLKNQQRLFT